MKLTLSGICLLLAGALVGCSSNVALLRDDSECYCQERLITACEDSQLCTTSRLYDVNWIGSNDFPVDYRAKITTYTTAKTQQPSQCSADVSQ
jgi:hypothetical protein